MQREVHHTKTATAAAAAASAADYSKQFHHAAPCRAAQLGSGLAPQLVARRVKAAAGERGR